MPCFTHVLVILAALAVTAQGISMEALETIHNVTAQCQHPQPIEHSDLLHVECKGLTSLSNVSQLLNNEEWGRLGSLTIRNSSFSSLLTLDDLQTFPALHTLTLNQSQVLGWRQPLISPRPRLKRLVLEQCWDNTIVLAKPKQLTLTLSATLEDVLPELEELHLIKNFMMHMAEPPNTKLKKLVFKNASALCEDENLWLLRWFREGLLEMTATHCIVREETSFFDISSVFDSYEVIQCLKQIEAANAACPKSCRCEVYTFGKMPDNPPDMSVDCTSANLTELPDLIPKYTHKITFNFNQLTNISKIFTSPHYQNLDVIRLSNNKINRFDTQLLYNYLKNRSWDLRIVLTNNKLETFNVKPILMMYKESQGDEMRMPSFDFSGNPWNCDDCTFITEFQDLIYHQFQESSMKEVRCGEGTYSEGKQIYLLPFKSYCKVDPLLEPLDILNICLGVLLFLFILNFLHNFIQYQRHGNLPWIVSKVPFC